MEFLIKYALSIILFIELFWIRHYIFYYVSESSSRLFSGTTKKLRLSTAGEKKIRGFLQFEYDLYYFVKKHFHNTVAWLKESGFRSSIIPPYWVLMMDMLHY